MVQSPLGSKNFSISMASRSAVGPTRPPVQWVPSFLSQEGGRGITAGTQSYLTQSCAEFKESGV